MGITATPNQTIEADGSRNSLATMTCWGQAHLAPTKKQKNHLAQPRWKDTQTNCLHHGDETIHNKCEHCQDQKLPRADIGSDHELVMMTFKLHLKKEKEQYNTRIRFDLEKLKDAEVAEIFQAKIGGKFAALSILDSDMDMNLLTDTSTQQ